MTPVQGGPTLLLYLLRQRALLLARMNRRLHRRPSSKPGSSHATRIEPPFACQQGRARTVWR